MIVISTNVKMVESALIWSVITNVNVNLGPMDTRANAKVDGMVGIANRISTNVSAINVRTEENV